MGKNWVMPQPRLEPPAMIPIRPFVFIAAVVLPACEQQRDPEMALPPVARASPGPVSPDGLYSGQMINTGGVGPGAVTCGTNDTFVLRVSGGKFRFVLAQPQVKYRPRIAFDLAIAPDGSFASPPGATHMRGKVERGHMEGQIAGDACSFNFQADRNGTW